MLGVFTKIRWNILGNANVKVNVSIKYSGREFSEETCLASVSNRTYSPKAITEIE